MDWLFYLLIDHIGQTKGISLGNVRLQIPNLDVVGAKELGGGVRNPEGLWGLLLGKNEILVEENQ